MYAVFSRRYVLRALLQKHAYIVRSLLAQTYLHTYLCINMALDSKMVACFAFHWLGNSFQ